jgi:hypothetical protein
MRRTKLTCVLFLRRCARAAQTVISHMYTHTEGVMDAAKPAWQVKPVPLP